MIYMSILSCIKGKIWPEEVKKDVKEAEVTLPYRSIGLPELQFECECGNLFKLIPGRSASTLVCKSCGSEYYLKTWSYNVTVDGIPVFWYIEKKKPDVSEKN